MASFRLMARWPVGYFRAFSAWLLNNRKTVAARVNMLNAEIDRIGFITVTYRGETAEDGSVTMTEERLGFSVTEGSSLARLVQAYIVNGGNVFDISPFWMPDKTKILGRDGAGKAIRAEKYPYGGLLAQKSAEVNEPLPQKATDEDGSEVIVRTGFGGYPGGQVETDSNLQFRLGTRAPVGHHDVVSAMRKMRDWANQDIKERLNNIEWRIVKLMDLREQLEKERDELLVQAFGGALEGLRGLPSKGFNPGLTVQSLVQDMYEILYEMDEATATVKAFRAGPDIEMLDFAVEDVSSEVTRDPLS